MKSFLFESAAVAVVIQRSGGGPRNFFSQQHDNPSWYQGT